MSSNEFNITLSVNENDKVDIIGKNESENNTQLDVLKTLLSMKPRDKYFNVTDAKNEYIKKIQQLLENDDFIFFSKTCQSFKVDEIMDMDEYEKEENMNLTAEEKKKRKEMKLVGGPIDSLLRMLMPIGMPDKDLSNSSLYIDDELEKINYFLDDFRNFYTKFKEWLSAKENKKGGANGDYYDPYSDPNLNPCDIYKNFRKNFFKVAKYSVKHTWNFNKVLCIIQYACLSVIQFSYEMGYNYVHFRTLCHEIENEEKERKKKEKNEEYVGLSIENTDSSGITGGSKEFVFKDFGLAWLFCIKHSIKMIKNVENLNFIPPNPDIKNEKGNLYDLLDDVKKSYTELKGGRKNRRKTIRRKKYKRKTMHRKKVKRMTTMRKI